MMKNRKNKEEKAKKVIRNFFAEIGGGGSGIVDIIFWGSVNV